MIGPGLAFLLDGLERRIGPIEAIAMGPPEVRVAANSGRVLWVTIDGRRLPFAVAEAKRNAVQAAIQQARLAHKEGRLLDSVPDSVREIRGALDAGLVDALRRVDGLDLAPDAWTYQAMGAVPPSEILHGQTVQRIRVLLEGAAARPKEVEMNLAQVMQEIDGCVAVAVVDMASGGLLGIETSKDYSEAFKALLGAVSKGLYTGANVQKIEALFRGDAPDTGIPRFIVWSGETEALTKAVHGRDMPAILHWWRRNARADRVYVFVAPKTKAFNYTLFYAQTTMAADALERARG